MSPSKMNGVELRRLLRLRRIMFAVVVTFSMVAAIDVIEVVHSKQNTSIMEMCMPRCKGHQQHLRGELKAKSEADQNFGAGRHE